MTRRGARLCALALAAATPALARAQDAAPAAAADEIVVTGRRESTLDLDRLRRAEAVFRAGRPTFAPAGALRMQLRPRDGASLQGLRLTLRSGDRSIAVPVDADGGFTLPDTSGGGWELWHNRGKDRIAVRALVLSPGDDDAHRRLGDLRLQCRVSWELMKPNYSFVARNGFAALGGCASPRFGFSFTAPRPLAAARVVEQTRTADLPLRPDRRSYRAPLGDRALSNDATVELRFE